MLTVKDINEVSFGKAGFSGYKPEDVDNFIDQVAASFQELLSQRDAAMKQVEDLARLNTELAGKNSDAQKKLAILAQKVEGYRRDEEDIKEAILNAQRMSKDLLAQAQQKADSIIQEARAQSEAKLLEANEEARRVTANAEADAAKAAREYAQQAEAKKAELEEVKRQVTAFRASLLEMYKKHLECIDHIPVFRNKEERQEARRRYEPEPEPLPEPEPVPVPEPIPAPEPVPEPEPMPAPEPEPAPRHAAVYEEAPRPKSQREAAPRQAPRRQEVPVPVPAPMPELTLDDQINYEQLQPSQPPEDYLDDDLSSVGIDTFRYSNTPEGLQREKDSNYRNLEFGDDVNVDGRKRRR